MNRRGAYIKTRPLPPNLKYKILGHISKADFQKVLRAYGVVEQKDKPQIEITPEMTKAGGAYVEAWDYNEPLAEDIITHQDLAKHIYLAMRRLEPCMPR